LCAVLAMPSAERALAQAATQESVDEDAGRFEIRVAGQRVGTEVFAIRRQGTGWMAVGRVHLDSLPAGASSFEVGLQTDARLHATRYELRPTGLRIQHIVGVRTGDRIRLSASNASGERVKEFLAEPEPVILERGVAHHYYFLLRRLRSGFTPTAALPLRALVPLRNLSLPLTVRSAGSDTIDVSGSRWPAERYELSVGGEARTVWADTSGRILRVEIPSRQWVATRLPQEDR